MQQIRLTYSQWKQVHPHYRSVIDKVPHVFVYDGGELRLARVAFQHRPASATPRHCSGQLRLRGA